MRKEKFEVVFFQVAEPTVPIKTTLKLQTEHVIENIFNVPGVPPELLNQLPEEIREPLKNNLLDPLFTYFFLN